MANNATVSQDGSQEENVMFSSQQLQHLLKFMPVAGSGSAHRGSDTEEELEMAFSGMVACNLSVTSSNAWIVDSGASDHMTGTLEKLINIKPVNSALTITLPTGDAAKITHMGDLKLKNGLLLSNVLVVPKFHHNLLSIHKLALDNECDVKFSPETCEVVCTKTKILRAVGRVYNGLYYLFDNSEAPQCAAATTVDHNLWHLRLGHASVTKMKHIPML